MRRHTSCYVAIVLSVVAIIFSIWDLVLKHFGYELKVDYLALLVGTLAVLVAILIGWQLHVTLGIKRDYDRMHDALERQRVEINKLIGAHNKLKDKMEERIRYTEKDINNIIDTLARADKKVSDLENALIRVLGGGLKP